jgi:hypothetical protein
MTGSPLIPIVAPLVILICLGIWIAIVFYADSHPGWKRWHTQAGSGPGDASAAPSTAAPSIEATGRPAAETTRTATPPAKRAA